MKIDHQTWEMRKTLKKVERKNEFEMEVIRDGEDDKKKVNKGWIN